MRAEIIAVGSELLLGESTDTNTAWIAARLAEIGVDVHRHTTVGDNVERMVAVITEAAQRADAVVVTGGLGPTQDDLTRQAVAVVAGVPLERRAELVSYLTDYFARAGRDMPASNLVQADLPAAARVLKPLGTAAGFAVDVVASAGRATIYCVPGVPWEMREMIGDDVVPELVARGGLATTVSRVVRTAGMSEAIVAEMCAQIIERLDEEARGGAPAPTIAFLASRGETRVRITAKAASREAALARLAPLVDELVELLGTGVAGLDDEGSEFSVARQLLAREWTLAVVESISAGGLGARLVRVPFASEWFLGGLVTYDTGVKTTLAGVSPELLDRHGPVSEEVVAALAEGARERLGADVGLAVVGVAGPLSQGGQPIGTVCVAAALPDVPTQSRTLRLPGRERTELQEWAAGVAIDFLRRRLAALG